MNCPFRLYMLKSNIVYVHSPPLYAGLFAWVDSALAQKGYKETAFSKIIEISGFLYLKPSETGLFYNDCSPFIEIQIFDG